MKKMRLIDADAWIQELRTQMSDKDCPGEIQDYCLFMINEINTRPTAYDVDAVVKEMERIKNDASQGCDEVSHDKCNTYKNCADCIFDRTIDIIKKCGIPAAEQEEGEIK